MGHYVRPLVPFGSVRSRAQTVLLLVLTAFTLYLASSILLTFLSPIAWALAFSVVSYPLFTKLVSYVQNRTLASVLMVLGLSIMGLLPAVWVAERLVIAGLDGLHTLLPLVERGEWAGSLKRYPILAQNITWIESTFHLQDTSREILEKVRRGIPSLVTASLWGIVQGMLIMFIAFLLFRDGRLLMRYTEGLLPLHRGETRHLINRMSDTIHATLFGMIAVALLQGGLGGLMFWWLGLPAPLIWGTIMTLLAVVPYLGTFIVWIPVAFYFALQGQWTSAAILVVWGSIVIGLSDNLLYPFLVGKRLHYHTLVVFFFLLGGIVLFGTAGVVLGPMILALSDGLVQVCRVRLELEGSNQG